MTERVFDNKKCVVGDTKSVRTQEFIYHVEQAFMQSPRKSVKRLSQQLNFEASSIYRTIRKDARTKGFF
jgi:predicted transcriptional regulator